MTTEQDSSPVARTMLEASRLRYEAHINQPDLAASKNKKAKKLLNQITTPVKDNQIEGIGAGGEVIFNMPAPVENIETSRLRNIVRNPNMIEAAAQYHRIRLTEQARVTDIALDAASTIKPKNSLEKMAVHQLSALHVLIMKMTGATDDWICRTKRGDNAYQQIAMIEAARGAKAIAKMVNAYQQGLSTIHKTRTGGQQNINVVHQHIQVAGGEVNVTGTVNKGRKGNGGSRRKK